MTVAIIDIGTNTFNLLVASEVNNQLVLEHVEKSFVFLGKGGINENKIQPDAFKRGVKTLEHFTKKAKKFHTTNIIAIATSAVRNATNGIDFEREVLETCGIEIKIISGNTEANYIYKGARAAVDFGSEPILLMDIGGGSTEFIICNNKKIFWKRSFEIGATRLFEKFHKLDPIQDAEIEAIESHLEQELKKLVKAIEIYKPTTLIGSAGAFTSIAKMITHQQGEANKLDKTSHYEYSLSDVSKLHEKIIKSNLNQRLALPGLIPARAPMIVVGTIIVNYIIQQFEIKQFKLARYALKEGVACDHLSIK